jgi:hypothetical protein
MDKPKVDELGIVKFEVVVKDLKGKKIDVNYLSIQDRVKFRKLIMKIIDWIANEDALEGVANLGNDL